MRVLIIQTTPLTGLVQSLPVASDLRRQYPGLAIDWCVEEGFAALPAMQDGVDRILKVAPRRWQRACFARQGWQETGVFRRMLRAVDYDAVFDLEGTLFSALIAHQACGPACGYATARIPDFLLHRLYEASHLIPEVVHPIERARWLIAAALELPLEMPLDFGLHPPPLNAEDGLPASPYVVLRPASTSSQDSPPCGYWSAMARCLQATGCASILSLPAGDETACASDEMMIAPISGLESLITLLAGAHAVIGSDVATLQLAAALGRPAIALHTAAPPSNGGILSVRPFRNLDGQGKMPDCATILNAFTSLMRSWPVSSTPSCSR